ncbi:MAG: hypothetical protein V1777_04690 [Candidatus Micrarchaeota archaeon]
MTAYSLLSESEAAAVKEFFLARHRVPVSFWDKYILCKRVNSVWVMSEGAWQTQRLVRADSAGLMLLLKLKSLKPSMQGLAFLEGLEKEKSSDV